MSDDQTAMLLQVSADLSKLQKKFTQDGPGYVDQGSKAMEKRAKQAATNMEAAFGSVDIGAALDKVFTSSRLKLLDTASVRIGLVGQAFEDLGAPGLAAAAAVGALGVALAGADGAAKFADTIKDTADRLHLTTDALQEYEQANRLAGGTIQGADEALESFSENLGKAQAGVAKSQKAFLELGFTPAQIKGFTDVDTALKAVTAKLQGLSSVQKDAVVGQLGLTGMKALVEGGADALNDALANAKSLGLVMDSELVQRGGELNKQFDTTKTIIGIELKSALVDLGPILLGMLQVAAAIAKQFAAGADSFKSIGDKSTSGLQQDRARNVAQAAQLSGRALSGKDPLASSMVAAANQRITADDAELAKRSDADKASATGVSTKTLTDPDAANKAAEAAKKIAEQTAQVSAAVAQAVAGELQAQLGLTTDVGQRATIEKQTLAAQLTEQQSKTERQIAAINGDKDLSAAQKAELIGRLQGVEQVDAQTAALKARLIDEQAADALAKNLVDVANAQLDGESAVLQLQGALVHNATAKRDIDLKLLDIADQRAAAEYQLVLDSQTASATEKKIAQAQLDALNASHGLKQQQITDAATDAIAQETLTVLTARQDALTGLLGSEKDLAQYGFQQRALALQILDVQQQIEREKLEEVVNSKTASDADKAAAQAQLSVLATVQANQKALAKGNFEDAYKNVTDALTSTAQAFTSHDWNAAMKGLIEAIGTAKTAFGSTGSLSSQIGAVSGLANAAGQAIGGKAGGVLSGAGSGAMAGAEIGSIVPGIGTAIGAVVGGLAGALGGLFGNSTARDDAAKARDAANLQTALDAATAAGTAETAVLQKLADAQSSYSSELVDYYTASGQAAAATAEQRRQQLAGLDASNAALQQSIYAWDDYNDAVTAATDKITTAQSALQSAYSAQSQDLSTTISKFQDFQATLATFRQSLDTGDLTGGSTAQQYAAAQAVFDATTAAAKNLDETALGDLPQAGQDFLAASKANASSALDYQRDLSKVKASTDAVAALTGDQVDVSQQQLDALNTQVSGLISINDSVLTVAQAISNLQAALSAKNALVAPPVQTALPTADPSNPNQDWSVGGTLWNTWAASGKSTGANQGQAVIDDWNRGGTNFLTNYIQAQQIGSLSSLDAIFGLAPGTAASFAVKNNLPTFATGGSFTIGGSGGVDTNLMSLNGIPAAMVSRGEMVNITKAGAGNDNATVADRIGRLEYGLIAIAKQTSAVAAFAKRWDVNGLPVRGLDPSEPLSVQVVA